MSYAQLRSTQNVGVVTIHPGGDQKAYDAALADNTRKELETVTGSTKAEAFVKKYGLYFITSATYGGLFTMTKSAETTSGTSAASLSAELTASYGVASGSVKASDDTSSSQESSSSKAKVKCYGGDLAKCSDDPEKFQEWAASVGDQADVVDYTITPIYKLRDPDDPRRAILKAAFHSLEAKLLGGLQAQWMQTDISNENLGTVAIKSVSSNRFCRLNRKESDMSAYIIACDGSAKYTGKYLHERFNNQEKRTSFLAFVFSLVPSEREGEFTLQAWALNNRITYADGTTLPNQGFAIDHKCGIADSSSEIVCSPSTTEATVFQIESQGAGLYTLTAVRAQDSAFGVSDPGHLCGTNSADSSIGCPAFVNVSTNEVAAGFNAQFVIEVLAPDGQTFHGGNKLNVGEVMRAGSPPLVNGGNERTLFVVLQGGNVLSTSYGTNAADRTSTDWDVPGTATVELSREGRVLFKDDKGNVAFYFKAPQDVPEWGKVATCIEGPSYMTIATTNLLAVHCKNGTTVKFLNSDDSPGNTLHYGPGSSLYKCGSSRSGHGTGASPPCP